MTLFKTSLLNGIAVIIKMATMLGLNKVLAIYVGPSGYASLGQFRNAVQMITAFSSGAINTGVTKYTAEYHADEFKQHILWRTAASVALIGSLISALLIIVFDRTLAGIFFDNEALSGVFFWFGATLVLFVFNTLLLAILNGKKEIKVYVLANIAGSISALVLTSIMAIQFGLYGALVSLATYQSLTFFVTLLLTYRAPWFKVSYLIGRIDKHALKNLTKYTAMALTSAACVPVSHILIRDHLGETLGWNAAGYWEAMWRLSDAYLMFVTTTLSVYYLPRLSELEDPVALKHEILQGYKVILPLAAACGLTIYLLRTPITSLLFSTKFSPIENLYAWQMVGDTFKIGSWVLAYLMLGKAMTKVFILTEIASSILFYVLTLMLTSYFGLKGVAIAHSVNYFVYWLLMFILIAHYFRKKNSEQGFGM